MEYAKIITICEFEKVDTITKGILHTSILILLWNSFCVAQLWIINSGGEYLLTLYYLFSDQNKFLNCTT